MALKASDRPSSIPEYGHFSTSTAEELRGKDAVAALNTIQTNHAVVEAIRKSGRSLNTQAIPEMLEWCRKIGYEPSDLNDIAPIHIAGTKGKGSTGAFVSSILAQYIPTPSESISPGLLTKIGLYTSPHLRFVRERIRINNEPISETLFAKYFFQVWDRLEEVARKDGKSPTEITAAKPVYFRFLTLMAFHIYMQEGVDTAVIECGIGGEYDSTNIIVKPTTTGITSLGIDHTSMLGETIEEIAWHKAGIMKEGAKAFTAPQAVEAIRVLTQRAEEKKVELKVVDVDPRLQDVRLGLAGGFQKVNASLAIQIAAAHLMALGLTNPIPYSDTPLPRQFVSGLERIRWPGRCEVRKEEGISWHIDGGHTLESIRLAAEWFGSQIPPTKHLHHQRNTRILLFNQQTRDAPALAEALHDTLSKSLQDENPFSHVVFCTNITSAKVGYRPELASSNINPKEVQEMKVQRRLRDTWLNINPESIVEVKGSIEEAVHWVRGIAKEVREDGERGGKVMVLATGSLHLVGGFLDVLESEQEIHS